MAQYHCLAIEAKPPQNPKNHTHITHSFLSPTLPSPLAAGLLTGFSRFWPPDSLPLPLPSPFPLPSPGLALCQNGSSPLIYCLRWFLFTHGPSTLSLISFFFFFSFPLLLLTSFLSFFLPSSSHASGVPILSHHAPSSSTLPS